MAEITVRRTGEHLRKLFAILSAAPDGLPAGRALELLANEVTMTPHEAGNYESGSRRFEKIVRFATVDCVKAGWLRKHKGTWSLTEAGLAAYKQYPDPETFYREAVRLYRAWKAAQVDEEQIASPGEEPGQVLEKSTSINFEEAEEQAWSEIVRYVGNMPWQEFQDLVADLLKAMGYYVGWIAPPGKDGGIDIVAHPDPLGTQSPRIKVQVKRMQSTVNADGIRAFCALINDDDVGLFVTTGGFTRDAQEFARNQERRKVTLIDLERLLDLWTTYYQKLDDRARRRLPLTPIYFLTPEN